MRVGRARRQRGFAQLARPLSVALVVCVYRFKDCSVCSLVIPRGHRRVSRLSCRPHVDRGVCADVETVAAFQVGAKVEAKFAEDGCWYMGVIEHSNGDDTFEIKWDDPDGGPLVSTCPSPDIKPYVVFADYKVGDMVTALWPDDGAWYNATVASRIGDATFVVDWDDPDGGPDTSVRKAEEIAHAVVHMEYSVGDRVEAMLRGFWSDWSRGVVVADNGNGTFQVYWDDREGGPESTACKPRYMKHICRDFEVGDRIDAKSPEDFKWYPGVVGSKNADGTFQVKWDEPGSGPERSTCMPEDMKGVHRTYKVGDKVEAVYAGDHAWHTGIVEEDFGNGGFEVRWDDGGLDPETSMCTPEEMSLIQEESYDAMDYGYDEWYEDDMENGDGRYGSGTDDRDDAADEDVLDDMEEGTPYSERWRSLLAGSALAQVVLGAPHATMVYPTTPAKRRASSPCVAWTASKLCTLRLKQGSAPRGRRRLWRLKPISKLLGWTSHFLGRGRR